MMQAILILPFIPWIFAGLVALIVGSIVIAAIRPMKTKGKTVGVLGMVEAGKSRFLFNLGLIPFSEGSTNVKDYDSHILNLNNRKVEVLAGADVGGDVDIKRYYNKWVEEKDITIFIFDGPRFLKELDYEKDVRRRLHFIYVKAKKKSEDDSDFRNIVIIVSHSDQYDRNKSEMLVEIVKKMQDKKYCSLLQANVFAADLRSKEEVMEIANQIF